MAFSLPDSSTSLFVSPHFLSRKELTWGQFIIQRQEEPVAPNKKPRGGPDPGRKPAAGFDAFDDDDVSAIDIILRVNMYLYLCFLDAFDLTIGDDARAGYLCLNL